MGEGTGPRKLDKFEKLIRDAIALLIKQGKITVPQKEPAPVKDQNSKNPQVTGGPEESKKVRE